jgi:hypothetical protein
MSATEESAGGPELWPPQDRSPCARAEMRFRRAMRPSRRATKLYRTLYSGGWFTIQVCELGNLLLAPM